MPNSDERICLAAAAKIVLDGWRPYGVVLLAGDAGDSVHYLPTQVLLFLPPTLSPNQFVENVNWDDVQ